MFNVDNLAMSKWWVDASYTIHEYCKGYTGTVMNLGKGAMTRFPRRKKIQGKSYTEDKLIGSDDTAPQEICTKYFLEDQGYTVEDNIMYQDNKSAILLDTDGKMSSSNRTKYIKVLLIFIKDIISCGYLSLYYFPTEKMWSYVLTKPLQGPKFKERRAILMN